jgi:hypothetical protein
VWGEIVSSMHDDFVAARKRCGAQALVSYVSFIRAGKDGHRGKHTP